MTIRFWAKSGSEPNQGLGQTQFSPGSASEPELDDNLGQHRILGQKQTVDQNHCPGQNQILGPHQIGAEIGFSPSSDSGPRSDFRPKYQFGLGIGIVPQLESMPISGQTRNLSTITFLGQNQSLKQNQILSENWIPAHSPISSQNQIRRHHQILVMALGWGPTSDVGRSQMLDQRQIWTRPQFETKIRIWG